ncbi:related to GET1 [Lecanosticta acicola]|uniref:Related to GET1 n=1 Tax=Lecanosticta acicola TaxID=111012 RepID=A0AAI8YYQ7_9PEZI|nr:related to GET1 [Lecanosticta acicola]
MISVILVVFLVQLALSLISSVGAQTVNDLAWWIFTRLPTQQTKQAEQKVKLRNEVIRLNREMIGVSAQDNFAKWARLRREHDKAKEKYEQEAAASQSFRSSFDSIVSKLRWLGTQGVNFILNTWYAKQPMFWLPQGWVPHQAEWLLSFPRAPLGSISVNVWAIACGSVIAMISEGIVALWTLKSGEVKTGPNKGEKLKMSSAAGAAAESETKKEL